MFWLTTSTMKSLMGEDYHAWELFGPVHLFWIGLTVVLTILVWTVYPRFSKETRGKLLIAVMILMVADELFKDIPTVVTGQFEWEHLPFHLCSVNIFTTVINAWKKDKYTNALLACVCIPAALCAIVVPTWTALPIWNFNHLHSETVHILLFIYPMMILAGGYRPEKKMVPVIIAYICGLAVFDKIINTLLGTNFLFLTHNEDNPALIFLENHTGKFYDLGIVLFLIVFCCGLRILWNRIPVKE